MAIPSVPSPNAPLEALVSRLGDYMVEKGILSPADLQRALTYQQNLRKEGQQMLLGQVLLEMNLVDKQTLDQAISERIIELQTALIQANQQLERRVEERTAELQVALKKLSELNQLKSNIIANVSHELRTPMTHIQGYLELLATQAFGPLTPEQDDAVKVMSRSSERLRQLIEDMIRFSTASQGELTLKMGMVDLATIFQYAAGRSVAKAKEKNLALGVQMPPDTPAVKGDSEKITWVIIQLLDNAIKFTDPAGQVVMSAKVDGEFVRIAVTDTGIGIPADRINELFEPFHQLDGSSTRRYGGTGLGLAMVRQIIDAHGSSVHVFSKVGKGSRFEFNLPLYSE